MNNNIVITKGIIWREEIINGIGNVILIFNLRDKKLLLLENEISKEIWRKLTMGNKLHHICKYVADKYNVNLEIVEDDISTFLKQLKEEGVICYGKQ